MRRPSQPVAPQSPDGLPRLKAVALLAQDAANGRLAPFATRNSRLPVLACSLSSIPLKMSISSTPSSTVLPATQKGGKEGCEIRQTDIGRKIGPGRKRGETRGHPVLRNLPPICPPTFAEPSAHAATRSGAAGQLLHDCPVNSALCPLPTLELRCQLPLPPNSVTPTEAAQQPLRVDTCARKVLSENRLVVACVRASPRGGTFCGAHQLSEQEHLAATLQPAAGTAAARGASGMRACVGRQGGRPAHLWA